MLKIALLLATIATILVAANSGLLQDADARDSARDRANKVLDKHIEAGGAHGEKAQKIKDRLNNGGGDPCPGC